MTTKKVLLIIGGVVAVLALLGGLVVGGIVYVAFSTIGKSEAALTAKNYLRQNERLKNDIGEVRDFGFWVTGNINSQNNDGEATLNLKTIGAKKTVPASVNLTYRNGRNWVVVKASYTNDAGQTVNLLNPYEAEAGGDDTKPGDVVVSNETTEKGNAGTDDAGGGFDEASFAANVTRAQGTTLVVFLSDYSLDSQALEKTLNALADDYAERVNLVRYSVDAQPVLYKRFNIDKLPLVLIYKDGREQERRAGAISQQQLAALLDKSLGAE
ncbi:MAG TPA: cytochrome c oxidase assembly factor Coa1 family protein [Pyrinomonadaceae bacterium]|jgi:thiol-disulfide isomerase/thioredoxin